MPPQLHRPHPHANRSEASKPAAASSSAGERKFCITPDKMTTGSRLYIRECLTKAEWARRGIEVDEDSKQP